mgnify:CR=1 FL=1
MGIINDIFNRNKPNDSTTVGEWKDPNATIAHHPTTEASVNSDFECMYCLNIEDYRHFLNTSIDAGQITPHTFDVTPYSPDWDSFQKHMYTAHPEQWGYTEILDTHFKIIKTRTSWNKDEIATAVNAYIQIRARLEYGWNFFAVVDGKVHRSLHSLPKDQTTITSIEWLPRINPQTGQPWIDWRFEKEGETHKRAQNVIPRLIGRTHKAITPMLRGARSNGGQVLLVSAKQNPKYAHLPPYVNTTCMFTDASLKKVINLRKLLGLEGPGNIGILRMRAENSSTIEKEENVINTEEEEKVADTSEPITVAEQEIVNIQDIATNLEELLPKNDHTKVLLKEIDGIFDYVRNKTQHEEDFYKIQDELNEIKDLNKGLNKDVTEAQAETKKVEAERDKANNQITALQAKLNNRGRDSTAAEVKNEMDKVTQKTLDKIRSEPNKPKKYV